MSLWNIIIPNIMAFLDRKSLSWLRLVCKEWGSSCSESFFIAKLRHILNVVTGFYTITRTEKELWSLCRFNLDRPRYRTSFYGDVFNHVEDSDRFVSRIGEGSFSTSYFLTDDSRLFVERKKNEFYFVKSGIVSMCFDYEEEKYAAFLTQDGKVLIQTDVNLVEIKGINNAVQICSSTVDGDYVFLSR